MENKIHLVECPRDAMQGWKHIIPTEKKVEYLNALLKVGFDTIDFGSFVSARAIPQMADTKKVIGQLSLNESPSKLLAIVANTRGAEEAVGFNEISYLGYPFSVSETFQLRNTNSTIEQSLERVKTIQNLCVKHDKTLVIYISMGFGNPYGDEYTEQIVMEWIEKLVSLGIKIISVADTVGIARPNQVSSLLTKLIPSYPGISIGVHLHSTPVNWREKTEAALQAGCLRFDGALKGIGGCPMANDDLVGNMDTSLMIPYFEKKEILMGINTKALQEAMVIADEIFR